MSERQAILKTLDNPVRILFWTLDEFLVMTAPAFLGMCLGSLSMMLAGLVLRPLCAKLKRKSARGALKHKIYWMMPTEWLKKLGKTSSLPSSHYRELWL